MVKKINTIAITIKSLLKKGMQPIKIARLLNVSKQKINYWKKTEIKYTQTRRKKLQPELIQKICDLAANKTTTEMSSRKIANLINEELKNSSKVPKSKKISITHPTICSYLNENMVLRKIRRAFYLNKEQKKKELSFVKELLKED